ncbi:MAG: hypothetical protein ACYCYO_07205 [Bacilli bacterium]
MVDALQTSDRHGVSTPADWMPGDEVVVAPPSQQGAMQSKEQEE